MDDDQVVLWDSLAAADAADQAKEDALTARRLELLEKLNRENFRLRIAADALSEVAQRMRSRMLPATSGEPEFTVDPQDVAELDAALRQYREATE